MACSNCSKCIKGIARWIMVSHLKWADIVAEYALFVLMAYLTDEWELGFVHAAGIINIWTGISKILTLGCAFVVDNAKLGNYKMLLYSSVSYSIGLAFLSMSTPPVLSNFARNCSEYRPECFGLAQKAMFYTSLVLIAVGMAGHSVSLDSFLDEQAEVDDVKKPEDDERCCTIKNLGNRFIKVVISGVAGLALPADWAIRFGVAAIYTFVATIVFFVGTPFYEIKDERKERGATINFSDFFHQTAPVWLSFVMCGVVSSIGNTFFVEQADKMKPMVGTWHVPLAILLVLSKVARTILVFCYQFVYNHVMKGCFGLCNRKELATLFGIGIAMLNAVLCCSTAAMVENLRHKDIMREHMHNTSIFWLVPQFFFLTSLDALFEESVKDFFKDQASDYKGPQDRAPQAPQVQEQAPQDQVSQSSLKKYTVYITHFVVGLGFMSSVLSVLAVAKISKRVARKSWFQKQIDDSHLEKYYWTLATLSAVSFIWYVVAVACYMTKKSRKQPS